MLIRLPSRESRRRNLDSIDAAGTSRSVASERPERVFYSSLSPRGTGEAPSGVELVRVDKMPSEAITQIAVSANQIRRRTQGCRMSAGGVA